MYMPNIYGNKVLITNHHLIDYAGSELTTYYIAKEFKSCGCDVTVATFAYDMPIKQLFESEEINVVNVLESSLTDTNFDLIWSHHSPVLSNCIFENNAVSKKIIFSSLSPFEPLEAPPVFINMLSLCLANSQETKDKLVDEGVSESNIYIFNNSVTDDFFSKFNVNKEYGLKKICIISSHIPDELLELTSILRKNNVKYDIYGLNHKFELITPEILQNYDAIITIGRSVQYGMAMGIPVYCYDRFGGPGWITIDNINTAEYYNFSGRCTSRKLTALEIYNEIKINFKKVFEQRLILHLEAKNRYSLCKNMLNIINKTDNHLIDIRTINKLFFMTKRMNEYYERELKTTRSKDTIIEQNQIMILNLTNQLQKIHSSRGWKVLKLFYKIREVILLGTHF